MPKMSIENELELGELCAYVSFYATAVWGIAEDAPSHPSHFMHPSAGKMTKSQLLSGVRQAANDTIEHSQDFFPEQVAAVDKACQECKVLTLSEVRRRYWNRYRKLIESGKVRNDTDYYLATSLLNDLSSNIEPAERRLLQELADKYEQRK